MADGDKTRRSTRVNFGLHPNRYGDTGWDSRSRGAYQQRPLPQAQDTEGQSETNKQDSSRLLPSGSNAHRKSQSVTSVASNTSAIRKQQSDIKLAEELSKIDEKKENIQREIQLKEFEVHNITDAIQKAKEELQNIEEEDMKVQKVSEIQKLDKQLDTLTQSFKRAKIDADYEIKKLNRQYEILQKKGVLETLMIDAEDDQNLGSDEEDLYNHYDAATGQTDKEIDLQNMQVLHDQQRQEEERLAEAKIQEDKLDAADRLVAARAKAEEAELQAQNAEEEVRYLGSKGNSNLRQQKSRWQPTGFPDPPHVEPNKFYRQQRLQAAPVYDHFYAKQAINLELPYFDGNIKEWPVFLSQFMMTTEACNIPDVQNLQRLQKYLKGEARERVQAQLVSHHNVWKIMEKLEKRFGNPESIVDNLVQQAKALPTVPEGNFGLLLKFVDTVDNLVVTAESLQCEKYASSAEFLKILVKKLPISYQTKWGSFINQNYIRFPTLTQFAEWLNDQGDDISRIFTPVIANKVKDEKPIPKFQDNRNKAQVKWQGGDRRPTGNVMVAAADDEAQKPDERKKKCLFCYIDGHKIQDCRKFKGEPLADRVKWARSKRLCFRCLNYGHNFAECRSQQLCDVNGCNKKHHPLIHQVTQKKEEKKNEPEEHEIIAHAQEAPKRQIAYQIIPITLRCGKKRIKTFAMLDLGSAFTLLDENLAKRLGLERQECPFSFKGMEGTIPVPESSLVDLEIISDYNGTEFVMKDVRTYGGLNLPVRTLDLKAMEKHFNLKEVDLIPFKNAKPMILIGQDHADLIVALRRVDGTKNGPIASETKLGWVLNGRLSPTQECPKKESIFFTDESADDYLHNLVKSHFTTEDFGVKVNKVIPRSKEDKRAEEILQATAKKTDDRWEVGLLWKTDDVKLPISRPVAEKRLRTVEKKMDANPIYAEMYCNKIQEYLNKGYLYQLTPVEAMIESPRTSYLPHFGVFNPNKPGKFRLVNDAAVSINGVSLNDHLLKGPDYVPPIASILFKFRERAIAFTGDITDMFHRVRVRQEDLSAQRLLWRGMDRDRPPDVYVMCVLMFGAASSPCSAQYIKNRNAVEEGKDCPEAVAAIIEKHYVDDYLDSCDTVEEAYQRFQEVFNLHAKGNFHICKWISNSKELNEMFPEDLRAGGKKNLITDSSGLIERVLGLYWDPENDIITFTTTFHKVKEDVLKGNRIPTKREALALVMSIYDELGLLSLFTVKAKMILQDTWRNGVGWDDELPQIVHEKWIRWIGELHGITKFKVPRLYSPMYSRSKTTQLNMFVDASEEAFSAVAYFRVQEEDKVEVTLVSSKAKVAPLKPLSVPRLELQAAVLGTRLASTIKEHHQIKPKATIYWTDSSTVLRWIRADGRQFQQFVAHRIGEIQEVSEVNEWRWIPTSENVADEATRSNQPSEFGPDSRWVNGPPFLKLDSSRWPKEKVQRLEDIPIKDMEFKREFICALREVKHAETPININNFSSYLKLIRTTATVNAYIRRCYTHKHEQRTKLKLTVGDLNKAEMQWIEWSQRESFGSEIRLLQNKMELLKGSHIAKLSPMLDSNGIIRMQGRIPVEAEVFAMDRNPIILDPKHPLTVLIIDYYHIKAYHHGMERVVNDLKQKYCIPSIRVAVKRAWYNCQICKNRRAEPVIPQMGKLPLARLNSFVSPFTVTGLDYFGPMDVTVGYKRREKRYGALFTCMSTRAVHLELAGSLDTDSCLMAIRRFIARRGNPREIFSDNGTNFVGANNELKGALKELNQDKIHSSMTNEGISWHFNPPAAPHMGGAWERLVQAVKKSISAVLKERAPREELLVTLLAEAENTVNGRPLTHVSTDPDDLESLTPNHFLIGRSNNINPWRKQDDEEKCLKRKWKQVEQMADLFWRRWVKEYLPTLTKRDKWHHQQQPLKVDDIVLVVDPLQPRNTWLKGRVVEVYPGADGQVRTVKVQTANGTYKRPVVKLCPLDVRPRQMTEEKPDDKEESVLCLMEICKRNK